MRGWSPSAPLGSGFAARAPTIVKETSPLSVRGTRQSIRVEREHEQRADLGDRSVGHQGAFDVTGVS